MRPSKPRCALARIIPKTAATEDEIFEMAQRAWHEHGLFLGRSSQFNSFTDKQTLENMGNHLYGKRAKS